MREYRAVRYASIVSPIEIGQSDYQAQQFALWPYYTDIIPHLFHWLSLTTHLVLPSSQYASTTQCTQHCIHFAKRKKSQIFVRTKA
jgi:hypothetical protein